MMCPLSISPGVFVRDRFVPVGIEGVAGLHRNRLHIRLLQQARQLAMHQQHTVDPRLILEFAGQRGRRAIEIVHDRQQARQHLRARRHAQLEALGIGAALVVGELGAGALPAVKVFRRFGLGLLHLLQQVLE